MGACPACGFDNAPAAKFCSECGAQLDAAAPTRREERKVVTVVFADLVGSTARAEQLDPEDVRAILAPYHDRLRGELERHGGTVEKFIGDAVVGVFGAPVAHEDDPERAVRAALAIQEAIAELNEATPQLELEVRVGVHTGDALVTVGARPELGEAMVAGDVMNTAARLQSAAPPGGVLVGEPTYRATDRAIEYADADPVSAKGKQAAARGLARARTRAPGSGSTSEAAAVQLSSGGSASSTRSPARSNVLARRVSRSSSPSSAYPGSARAGSSTSCTARSTTIRSSLPGGRGARCRTARASRSGRSARSSRDRPASTRPTTSTLLRQKLGLAVRDLIDDEGEASWVERNLRLVVGLGGETSASSGGAADAAAAWRRFIEALADSRPTVLVFEDLHWADDGLLDFVDELVDWATDVPLLVVATARPELLERRPGWGGGKRNAATLSLGPLTDKDTARLVGALLERSLLPAETQSELLAHAGGNPLYAEEFARMHAVGGGAGIPDSLQAIVAARIDALPADEKSVLQVAAVLGKVFWTGALDGARRAIGRAARGSSALAGAQGVRPSRAEIRDGGRAAVRLSPCAHPRRRLRAASARRARSRSTCAQQSGSRASAVIEDHADLVAYHYGAALALARAASVSTAAFEEHARHGFKRAGDRASRLAAFSAAIGHYSAALELWPAHDAERADVLFGLGRARSFIEQMGEEELVAARDLYSEANDVEGAAAAERELSRLFWLHGETARADALIDHAVELLDGAPPSRVQAEVLVGLSGRHMLRDDFERAIEVGERALAIATAVGDEDARVGALLNIGASRARTDGWEAGRALLEEAVAIGREVRSWQRIRGIGMFRDAAFERGDLPLAADALSGGPRGGAALRSHGADPLAHRGTRLRPVSRGSLGGERPCARRVLRREGAVDLVPLDRASASRRTCGSRAGSTLLRWRTR